MEKLEINIDPEELKTIKKRWIILSVKNGCLKRMTLIVERHGWTGIRAESPGFQISECLGVAGRDVWPGLVK